MNFITRKAFEK